MCRVVYFATEEFSDSTFTIVNAMLYNLFMEQHSLAQDDAVRDEYHTLMLQCRANLETCLANLPLFLSAKIENVQALLLGVSCPGIRSRALRQGSADMLIQSQYPDFVRH